MSNYKVDSFMIINVLKIFKVISKKKAKKVLHYFVKK